MPGAVVVEFTAMKGGRPGGGMGGPMIGGIIEEPGAGGLGGAVVEDIMLNVGSIKLGGGRGAMMGRGGGAGPGIVGPPRSEGTPATSCCCLKIIMIPVSSTPAYLDSPMRSMLTTKALILPPGLTSKATTSARPMGGRASLNRRDSIPLIPRVLRQR